MQPIALHGLDVVGVVVGIDHFFDLAGGDLSRFQCLSLVCPRVTQDRMIDRLTVKPGEVAHALLPSESKMAALSRLPLPTRLHAGLVDAQESSDIQPDGWSVPDVNIFYTNQC